MTRSRGALAGLLLGASGLIAGVAAAGDAPGRPAWQPPPCLRDAAIAHGIHPDLMTAIVLVESGGNPLAINVNQNGRGRPLMAPTLAAARTLIERLWRAGANFDIGLGQINIRTALAYGLHPAWLLDPCWNLAVAARHLREKIAQFGYTWTAIERYNGRNPTYPWKIFRQLQALRGEGHPGG